MRSFKNVTQYKLRYEQEISYDDQMKTAVLYGTSELTNANDDSSFTRELHKVVKKDGWRKPILEITG